MSLTKQLSVLERIKRQFLQTSERLQRRKSSSSVEGKSKPGPGPAVRREGSDTRQIPPIIKRESSLPIGTDVAIQRSEKILGM